MPPIPKNMTGKEYSTLWSLARRGDMMAKFFLRMQERNPDKVYTNDDRPDAATMEEGTRIYNRDDNADNLADGTFWRNAMGTITGS